MPKKYTEAFKIDAVRLLAARGSKKVSEVAASLGVTGAMLYRWQASYGAAARPPAETEVDADVEALRRRLRVVEQENAFLKKACAFFAKEGA